MEAGITMMSGMKAMAVKKVSGVETLITTSQVCRRSWVGRRVMFMRELEDANTLIRKTQDGSRVMIRNGMTARLRMPDHGSRIMEGGACEGQNQDGWYQDDLPDFPEDTWDEGDHGEGWEDDEY